LLNLSGSLGVSGKIWANAFIRDISGLVNINGQPYGSESIDLTNVTSNINPSIDNSGSLGISGRMWRNAFIRDLSVGSIDISVNINPLNNNSRSLGASNALWGNAFITKLTAGSIDVSVNINPFFNDSGSLGDSNISWGNAFIRDLSVTFIDVSTNLNPLVNNNGSLGAFNDNWGNAYIRDISATSISISRSVVPLINNTRSLGTSTRYWNSAYSNRLAIAHTFSNTASTPGNANINGVGLYIENLNTSSNQRAIMFLRTMNSSINSRASICIVVGFVAAWHIGIRQEDISNSLFFFNGETGVGNNRVIFNSNGNATCTTLTTSDDRLKHNEIIINNGLTIIDQLVPKFYQKTQVMLDANYNGDLSGYTWTYESGLIAQELLQIKDISFVVQGGDYYDSNNVFTQRPYTVCYCGVFIYGLAAIKELHAKVKTQESSIVNLQSSILNQQTIINSLISRIEALKNKVS
jgi:hypothetical protein